jgi:hypothetical protein
MFCIDSFKDIIKNKIDNLAKVKKIRELGFEPRTSEL